MRIMFINNDGGGFADYVSVESGITIAAFIEKQMGTTNFSRYLIRVNREPTTQDYVLREGDRVTVTPTKIEGACGEKKS